MLSKELTWPEIEKLQLEQIRRETEGLRKRLNEMEPAEINRQLEAAEPISDEWRAVVGSPEWDEASHEKKEAINNRFDSLILSVAPDIFSRFSDGEAPSKTRANLGPPSESEAIRGLRRPESRA